MNIKQLRAQIAALQDATMDENKNFHSSYDEGKFDALSAVDALLDSMQGETISEDLEEEIQKTIHNHFFDLNGIAIAGTSVYATVDDMVYIAKHFANWQKEQMMKDAAEATLLKNNMIRLKKTTHPLYVGDKVKVIIIKSE